MCVCLLRALRTGDLACSPVTCTDWESNQWSFGSQAGAHSTEPHQPGQKHSFKTIPRCTKQFGAYLAVLIFMCQMWSLKQMKQRYARSISSNLPYFVMYNVLPHFVCIIHGIIIPIIMHILIFPSKIWAKTCVLNRQNMVHFSHKDMSIEVTYFI